MQCKRWSCRSFRQLASVVLMLVGMTSDSPATGTQSDTSQRPPNIVFILADDLGYAGLGCYGQKKILTPNIDRLAAEGMRFTQCYAGSHVCAPSRSVLMTGLHAGHTPIRQNGSNKALLPEDVTVAEVLNQAGYVTGCFGKWGLGVENTTGHPNLQGFDEFFGQLHQVHAHFYYPYWLWKNTEKFFLPENEGRRRVRYMHDEIHAQMMDFVRRHKDRPMFVYVPYTIPHVELVVPEDSMAPYRGKFPEEPLPDPRKGYIGADEPYATLAGMVSRMDGHVGALMASLEQFGVLDDTVIFFSSDNGGQGGNWTRMTDFFNGNGPLRGYKGQFYEGGIRVPMIVRWPAKVQPGRVTDHLCGFWDILPTLAEIAGVAPPEDIDGISLLPTLLGRGTQKQHDYLYWEYPRGDRLEQAVRRGRWKALTPRAGQPLELYDLEDDVSETANLADRRPDVVREIRQILATARTERRPPIVRRRPTVDDYVR